MRIKVRGGTVAHGEAPLCHSCCYSMVVRGVRLDDELVSCRALPDAHSRITFPVTFCTGYVSREHPTLHDMEEIAWVLRTDPLDPRKKRLGFVQARSLPPRERFVLRDE